LFNADQISLCSRENSLTKDKKKLLLFFIETTVFPELTAGSRSVVYLVLQGAVLALGLFADDDQVQVVVAGAVARQAVHMHHVSKQVQLTPGERNK